MFKKHKVGIGSNPIPTLSRKEGIIMRNIKLNMTQGNYIGIDHTHIFMNFTKENFDFLGTLPEGSKRKIHVFITSPTSITDSLKMLVNRYGKHPTEKRISIVVIHVPTYIKETVEFIQKLLKSYENAYQLYVEGRWKSFLSFGSNNLKSGYNYIAYFKYFKDHLSVKIHRDNDSNRVLIKFPEYYYNEVTKDSGIFSNIEEKLNPIAFKDKLIKAFKRECPEQILKSFKSDDDIFNYIVSEGEWDFKDEVIKIEAKDEDQHS